MGKPLQYIGLSGVDNQGSLATISQRVSSLLNGPSPVRLVNNIYTAMAGPNIAIRGGTHKPQRDTTRSAIGEMLELKDVTHFLHYSPLDAKDSLESPLALWQAFRNISGFQISQARVSDGTEWPRFLKRLREQCSECIIVLQIGSELVYGVREKGVDVKGLADVTSGNLDSRLLSNWLQPFVKERAITHVLWDLSGGSGETLDIAAASQALLAIQSSFPEIGLVVAGGLSGGSLQSVAKLTEMGVRNLSLDAASGLRYETTDLFSSSRALDFVAEAFQILNQHESVQT